VDKLALRKMLSRFQRQNRKIPLNLNEPMKSVFDSSQQSNAFRAIIFGGLLSGILDLTAACVTNYWISPVRIFQSIASGLLGPESYNGGVWTAVTGIFLHFVIAFGATTVFYLASRTIKFLIDQAVISGLLYGAMVYWFMELVVLPLSAFTGKNRFAPAAIIKGLIIHTLCVGLPIALVVRRYSKTEK
jgi:hypothetical protein